MKPQKGQIIVELAILLPIAFFVIFILAELCFLFNAKQLLFLGSFQAARSYMVLKSDSKAEQCLYSAITPSVFRDKLKDVTYLKVTESADKIIAETVLLYRPVFPVLPLMKFMNITFDPDKRSDLVERAILERTADSWSMLVKSRVAVAAKVELVK